jgi:O-antigen/teichoic acid export membrane protein
LIHESTPLKGICGNAQQERSKIAKTSMNMVKKPLYHRPEWRDLVHLGGAMVVTRGVTILTGIALSVLLARSLGADGYGTYLFALTIAHILAMPVLMGLPTLLTRQVAIFRSQDDWFRVSGIIRWSIRFVGVSAFGICFIATTFLVASTWSGRSDPATNMLYILVLPMVVGLAFLHTVSAVLRGFEHPFWGSLPDGLIRPVILLGLVWLVIWNGTLSPQLAIILHGVAVLCALTWAIFMAIRYCTKPTKTSYISPRYETRTWLLSLLPLSLITASAMINSRLDIFMLGAMTTKENVAIYGIAIQISGVVAIGQTIVNTIVGPKIARMWVAAEISELQTLMTHASRLSLAAATATIIALVMFGQTIVNTLVGPEFTDTVAIALITSVGILFAALAGPADHALNMCGFEKLNMKFTVLMALTNATLNFALIPMFGPIGAAIASVTSMLIKHTACIIAVRRVLGLHSGIFYRSAHSLV